VGPTIVYSFMQAVGLVNDHAARCVMRAEAEAARRAVLLGFARNAPGARPRQAP